jgi:hypothetical protein
MHAQDLAKISSNSSPLSSTHQAGRQTPLTMLSPSPLLWTETEVDHLELHPSSLPLRPNERAQQHPCISRVPQASPLPHSCTLAANRPPTRSGHVTPDTSRNLTPCSLPVPLVHAREAETTPAPHWRSHSLSLACYDTVPTVEHLRIDRTG